MTRDSAWGQCSNLRLVCRYLFCYTVFWLLCIMCNDYDVMLIVSCGSSDINCPWEELKGDFLKKLKSTSDS